MAHLAPPTGRHRYRQQLLGLALLLVGISMALLAITGLTHPRLRPATLSPAASGSARPSSAGKAGAGTVLSPSAQATAAGEAGHGADADAASIGSFSGLAPIVVLQNAGDPELARSAAASFAAGGWAVTETGTFDGSILSTVAYYDPAVQGARAAAEFLHAHFAGIARVRPKFAGLPRGPIVVIVTNDYSQGRTTS